MNCDGSKAPGPDGFNGQFFQSFWYLISKDTTKAISHFFRSGKLLPKVNATNVTLIPKTSDASSPEMFRPISLCNFLYKLITKILANKLRLIMHKIISPNQSAFIKGRNIQDNILLAHDLVHNFHLKSNVAGLCIKLDLKKAFDMIRRESLLLFLKKIGCNDIWCNWIHECIDTPSFSILINGSPVGYFTSRNGIRQGDPISPLLFCICMEMFSCIVENAIHSKSFSSPFCRGDLIVSHLLFADDMLVFSKASPASAQGIRNCIHQFNDCSGLEVNISKSKNFYSESAKSLRTTIDPILHIPEGQFPVRYLGLPLISTRLKGSDCSPLISKIQKRIASWANKLLSRAGRIELVKPKDEGGLGIRKIRDINLACQLKNLWSIVNGKSTLWTEWFTRKYLKNKNFWTRKMPASPSWGARSIFRVREEAGYHICYILGDGKGIDFWKQPWHPAGLLTHLYPESSLPNTVSPTATVDQLLNDGEWDPNIQFTLPNINTILNTALISPNPSNLAIWKPTPSGDFSLSSAWKCIRTHNPKPPWTPSICSMEINLAKTLNLPNFILKKDPKTCNWITPDPGWWKLNTDASLKEDKAAIGGLLRDAACNIIGSFSINKSPKTIQELEMEAIQKGICTALRHNISNLWLESDSLYSVSVINGKARCLWKLIPTLATISAKLSELPAWKITHSWREANGAADSLSKFECPIKGEDIPSDSLPLDLINIIRSDFSGTIYTRS
ncbi:uncharacterized protein LOC143885910 [Tasmannia lanceolata]|uniref:uncharacterized protein LOC143885910 n=1 Tax=Tasmannia lanceolata TaxID=3420 RepID=UPI004064202C